MSELDEVYQKLMKAVEEMNLSSQDEKEKLLTLLNSKDKETLWNNTGFLTSFFEGPSASSYAFYLGQYIGILSR